MKSVWVCVVFVMEGGRQLHRSGTFGLFWAARGASVTLDPLCQVYPPRGIYLTLFVQLILEVCLVDLLYGCALGHILNSLKQVALHFPRDSLDREHCFSMTERSADQVCLTSYKICLQRSVMTFPGKRKHIFLLPFISTEDEKPPYIHLHVSKNHKIYYTWFYILL